MYVLWWYKGLLKDWLLRVSWIIIIIIIIIIIVNNICSH